MASTAPSASRRTHYLGCALLAGIAATAGLAALGDIDYGWIERAHEPAYLPLSLGMVLFGAATLSSIVGFAFSAIAGALIFHLVPTGVEAVQIMMFASIGIQGYTVEAM